jgi:hypothetical protein
MPPLAYRDRHNWTVGCEVAIFVAIYRLGIPSAAKSTMRARSTNRCGNARLRVQVVRVPRSSSVMTSGGAG